jgi:hypothetical protein
MTHLSLDQLVRLRERGLEPGLASAREHLGSCSDCQAEATRLDQRAARLRALPSLRPARDHWPVLRQKLDQERRLRRARWVASVGIAMAAGLALVVLVQRADTGRDLAEAAIDSVMARSSQLEQLIQSYNPDERVTDGTTAMVAGQLEARIEQLDRQLELAQLAAGRRAGTEVLNLWRQRVGLLDALVDVHLTRASQVGF